MSKRECFLCVLVVLLSCALIQRDSVFAQGVQPYGATATAHQYMDYAAIATPVNPPTGFVRWYQNSTTNVLTCIRSNGTDCTPQVDRTGDLLATTLSACPTGYTEYAAADGKALEVTIAAHGNVGTTGGSDTLTATFTGDSMPGHAHQVPIMIDQDNLVVQYPKVGVFGEGPDTGSGIMQMNNDGVTFTTKPFDLSESVSAGTPTGTNSTEDNRQAFIRIIECKKN